LCVAFTLDFDSELISATPIGFDQIFNSAITYQQPLSRVSKKVGVCIDTLGAANINYKSFCFRLNGSSEPLINSLRFQATFATLT
jgi:hypothetical protein